MFRTTLAALAFACALALTVPASAQSQTAFSYQGRIDSGGAAVDGTADLRFRLYGQASGGSLVGSELTRANVTVSHGMFSTELDFGTAAFFSGQSRWLEIDVRSPAGSGAFTTLSPRTLINPTPLAQGLAGIATTRAGTQSLDQNQYDGFWGGTTTDRIDITPTWESFTAGKTGALTGVALDGYGVVNGSPSAMTIKIYAGVGTSGALLGSTVVMVPQGQSNGVPVASFPNISVTAGQQYTISPTGTVFLVRPNALIAGSSVGPTSANPFLFKTFITPEASIAAKATKAAFADTAATVNWSGVSGVPANVSNAFSPWVPTTGGINFADGNVGIGNWAPQVPLHISGTTQIDTNVLLRFGGSLENGDTIFLRRFYYAANQSGIQMELGTSGSGSTNNDAFIITENGITLFQFNTQLGGQALKAGGGAWGVLSDARAKHDIQPLSGTLDRLLKLQGKSYEYIDPNAAGAGPGRFTGFVAQEVEPVFPQWIGATNGGMKTLNITGFEALTVEALRDLRAEKDAELNAKQREIDELKERLDRLEALIKSRR